MAKNLRAKIPESDELFICDTNASATKMFVEETQGKHVQIAQSPREAAENAVSRICSVMSSVMSNLFYR
jgi:hypothetical protein